MPDLLSSNVELVSEKSLLHGHRAFIQKMSVTTALLPSPDTFLLLNYYKIIYLCLARNCPPIGIHSPIQGHIKSF